MARQALATTGPALTEERIAATEGEFKGLVVALDAQAEEAREREERAKDLAHQMAYEGALTVPAVCEGIRLYQRRTVEDCLELGKRLLLLRELTQHGDWLSTLDGLGLAESTARRFMTATMKTVKSANLANLARMVQTAGQLLELLARSALHASNPDYS